jgi:acyl-CoA synthetase (AMP-forming)/AMP-acid ligase II
MIIPLFGKLSFWMGADGRTGIAAGASVPANLMERIHQKLNLKGLTICYGMTETSPVSYQTTLHAPLKKRIETVGTILPHTKAKIVKPGTTEVLPLGQRGELCVAGYLLQKGAPFLS